MYRRNERNGVLVYPGNRPPWIGRQWRGRRVLDAVSGFWFEEQYAMVNEFGEVVDSRNRDSIDYQNAGSVGGPGNPPGPYFVFV